MLTLVSSHTSIHFLQVSKARRKHKYDNDKKEQTNKATFVKKSNKIDGKYWDRANRRKLRQTF